MAKNIVICCDGTWNEPESIEGKRGQSTNVLKTVRAVLPQAVGADGVVREQIVYYDRGVGTANWWDRFVGGTFGVGLSDNVIEAYNFLANNYAGPEDRIYLFGFSRGAFTVRSLAGFVGLVGLINKIDLGQLPRAFKYYRTPPAIRPQRPELLEGIGRRHPIDLHFLGVWDTVGALGIPTQFLGLNRLWHKSYEFHDVTLSARVRNAYQALAIDERRRPFAPCLWDNKTPAEGQTIEQVWFPGVHSNVGGGYPDAGIANEALHWMLGKACDCGLAVDHSYLCKNKKDATNGKLYNSCKHIYRLRAQARRPLVTMPAAEKVDVSALRRRDAGNYAPGNLAANDVLLREGHVVPLGSYP